MLVKEAIVVIGSESGIRTRELAEVLGLDTSAVSNRREAARVRTEDSAQMANLLRDKIGAGRSLNVNISCRAARGQESQTEYYLAAEGRMLGNDQFLEDVKHFGAH
ncbi:MAG TPA: hypothetical protein VLE20_04890 [Blastocatellia bacterium]|nr:hypothetical protein [Blastocatellia bacterium]